MNDQQRNDETARKNLARQDADKKAPARDEPGYVYNKEGATIQNPGPVSGPKFSEGKPVGWPQLGDRVIEKSEEDIVGHDTPAENPGDKAGGEPLTPSEPGSSSIQRIATKDEDLSRAKTTASPKREQGK